MSPLTVIAIAAIGSGAVVIACSFPLSTQARPPYLRKGGVLIIIGLVLLLLQHIR